MTFLPTNIDLPLCFNKQHIFSRISLSRDALDGRIHRALQRKEILQLKNGLYIKATDYIQEPDKEKLTEFIASEICQHSYISLAYVLQKHRMLPSIPSAPITSVTTRTTRTIKNFAGNYTYSNIKPLLYNNSKKASFHTYTYPIASKAKALFDYLYLDSSLDRRNGKHLQHQLFQESSLQWENFSEEDFKEFDHYVWPSNSAKMMNIWHIIHSHFERKKIDIWAKELLG